MGLDGRVDARRKPGPIIYVTIFATLAFCPIVFITGNSGKNVRKLLNHAQMLYKQSRERVPTGVLNRLIEKSDDTSSATTGKKQIDLKSFTRRK